MQLMMINSIVQLKYIYLFVIVVRGALLNPLMLLRISTLGVVLSSSKCFING